MEEYGESRGWCITLFLFYPFEDRDCCSDTKQQVSHHLVLLVS